MTARATTPRVVDYTRMPLGRVTRTARDGRRVAVIARCPKCGRRGERSVSIPTPEDRLAGGRPYVGVTHAATIKVWGRAGEPLRSIFGGTFRHVTDNCSVAIDATNADDLLNLEERRRYGLWVAALREYVERY